MNYFPVLFLPFHFLTNDMTSISTYFRADQRFPNCVEKWLFILIELEDPLPTFNIKNAFQIHT